MEAGPSKTSFGDLQAVYAGGLVDLLADDGVAVVVGGQAVHELSLRASGRHERGVEERFCCCL